eukprot:c5768_g1_i1.p1 GENE.c5768_g1_i1~~c5768_g1_i1.p1  ORF type:complete len:460 (+),score=112.47 c5768_g1_i1:47-1381(+)
MGSALGQRVSHSFRATVARIDSRWVIAIVIIWNLYMFTVMDNSPQPVTPATQSRRPRTKTTKPKVPDTDVLSWLKGTQASNQAQAATQEQDDSERSNSAEISQQLVTVQQTLGGFRALTESNQGMLEQQLHDIQTLIKKMEISFSMAQMTGPSNAMLRTDATPAKQTLFLPIGPNDLGRFQNMYLSLKKFFDFDGVHEWIIVTPNKESEVAKGVLETAKDHAHLIKIMQDGEVVPQLIALPTTSWMTQQIIKIGGANVVKTRFYLVMDADLICIKPTSFADLIVNGKALTNVYDSMGSSTRQEWWTSAEKVLDMKIVYPSYFGVTPAFLSVDIAKGLHARIETVHKKDWATFLLENVYTYTFTEYTMYAVFAQASGMYGRYHISLHDAVYNHDLSMWFDSQLKDLDFEKILKNAAHISGHFIVAQSNTKIPAAEIRKKMGNLFD